MKTFLAASLAASALALGVASPSSATTLDFENPTSFASIAQFYNGGADSDGAVGPALDITFGGDALGLQNDPAPALPFFSNAPTPVGVMAPVGSESTMDIAAGIKGMISFYYASTAAVTDAVQVWSGLDGTGSVLASFNLVANAQADGCSDSLYCHFDLLAGSFSGVARSVTFGNSANVAAFDNVSVAVIPEPSTVALMLLGLGGLGVVARRGGKR